MAIKINLSGSEIGDDADVLSDLNITGAENVNIDYAGSLIDGNAKILYDPKISDVSKVEINGNAFSGKSDTKDDQVSDTAEMNKGHSRKKEKGFLISILGILQKQKNENDNQNNYPRK